MEADASASLADGQAFWSELENIVGAKCESHEHIDNALRSFIGLAVEHKQVHLPSEYDVAKCCYVLLDSMLFTEHSEYVRRQILYCLLQDDDPETLHLAAAIALYDGRSQEKVFELMQDEGAFARLVELVRETKEEDKDLHRLLLELLFEMSRIQKLDRNDLAVVDDAFILYLFRLIEELSDDADDPYHYPTIRVLLVFNEQYMCYANAPALPNGSQPLTNRIVKLLSAHGPSYRTFGENLILLLNREAALGPQLLILKLLYLLFTTPSTFEYFYTNDLHVLVDVIIRNLLDLDPGHASSEQATRDLLQDGHRALRHTYLRVLCPLLKNTQLAREGNNYKREELRKLLHLLVNRSSAHFAPVDETVLRLVLRCRQIAWLREDDDEQDKAIERTLAQVESTEKRVAKKLLGMSLDAAEESTLSVVDVSAKVAKEKPSVPAPRRKKHKRPNEGEGNANEGLTAELKVPSKDASVLEAMPEGGRSPFADDVEDS